MVLNTTENFRAELLYTKYARFASVFFLFFLIFPIFFKKTVSCILGKFSTQDIDAFPIKKHVIPRPATQAVGIRFSKWGYGLPRLLAQARNDVDFSEHEFWSSPVDPTVFRLDIHQHDVRTDPQDLPPGDDEIIPGRSQTSQLVPPGHYDGGDLTLGKLDEHVADEPQPPPIPYADDLLTVQVCKLCRHKTTPLGKVYGATPENRTKIIVNCPLSIVNLRKAEGFAHTFDRALFQSGYLGLGDAQTGRHLHLGLSPHKPQ